MACMYKVDPDLRCTLVRYDGETTTANIISLFERMSADEAVVTGLPRLTAVRRAIFQLTARSVSELARVMDKYDEMLRPPHAAIIASQALHFGIARQFRVQRRSDSGDFSVFRDLEDALEWAGLPRDIPDPFDERFWMADQPN